MAKNLPQNTPTRARQSNLNIHLLSDTIEDNVPGNSKGRSEGGGRGSKSSEKGELHFRKIDVILQIPKINRPRTARVEKLKMLKLGHRRPCLYNGRCCRILSYSIAPPRPPAAHTEKGRPLQHLKLREFPVN
jgi:hypothetical protein